MRVPNSIPTFAIAVFSLAIAWTNSRAHEGEDHGESKPISVVVSAAPRAEAASEKFELVAIANNGTLTIYLDRLRSNDPITIAAITVETPAGSILASPEHGGTYKLAAPWAVTPGHYDLIFTVEADGTADVLTASLEVPAAVPLAHSAPTVSSDGLLSQLRQRIEGRDPLLILTSIVGFALGVVVMGVLARRKLVPAVALLAILATILTTAALAHEGEDHSGAVVNAAMPGDRDLAKRLADGSLFVPKPTQRLLAIRTDVTTSALHRRTIELPGRIIPDPNASGYVQASAGGRLSAPTGGFPRLGTRVNKGDVLAYVTPPLQAIDVSDMRQRQGELDQQINIVERRIARFETLAQRGAVTQVQLDEAKLELQGLKDRRSALDRARVEPEALVAPVSGIVAEMNTVAGQMALTNTILFQIIEPSRLWVEALSFDALTSTQSAVAKTSGGRSLALVYQGSGFADRNQAVPVHFKIVDDASGLRAGQFVTVLAATEDEREGIAVPRASVVRTQTGQDLAFEHTSAERFEPRSVRIEPLDGERVLVVSGLNAGARIVTQGAELLDQVR
jgi:RND family efflux transporter MFP subunit